MKAKIFFAIAITVCLCLSACSENNENKQISDIESSVIEVLDTSLSSKSEEQDESLQESSSNNTDIFDKEIGQSGVESNPQLNSPSSKLEADLSDDSYQVMLDQATRLESFLRKNLTPDDHGGISVLQGDSVTLHIWGINNQKVTDALSAYTGKKVTVTLESANCSFQEMLSLSKKLETIELDSNELILPAISDEYNSITINISSPKEDTLKRKVEEVISSESFPTQCVNIYVMRESGKNPAT